MELLLRVQRLSVQRGSEGCRARGHNPASQLWFSWCLELQALHIFIICWYETAATFHILSLKANCYQQLPGARHFSNLHSQTANPLISLWRGPWVPSPELIPLRLRDICDKLQSGSDFIRSPDIYRCVSVPFFNS